MDDRQAVRAPGTMSVRVAAFGGVVFFVLIVIQANLRSGVPSATDSGQEIFRYVAQHQDRLQIGAVLLGLAMPAVLLWLSALFRVRLRAAEGGTPAARLFGRWFALAGIVLAVLSTIGACTIGYDSSGLQATAGIAVLLDSVWILLISFFLLRDPNLALP